MFNCICLIKYQEAYKRVTEFTCLKTGPETGFS